MWQGPSAETQLAEAQLLEVQLLLARLPVSERGTSTLLNTVANLLHDLLRLEEAKPLFEEALHACRSELGDRHEDTLVLINNLGSLLLDQV